MTLTFGIDYRPNWLGPGLVPFNDLFTSNFWLLPDSDTNRAFRYDCIVETAFLGRTAWSWVFYLGWKRFQKLDCLPKIGHLRHRIWRNGEALGGFCKPYSTLMKDCCCEPPKSNENLVLWKFDETWYNSFKALHGPFAEVLLYTQIGELFLFTLDVLCLLHALHEPDCL